MPDTPGADAPSPARLAGHVQDFERLLVTYFDALRDSQDPGRGVRDPHGNPLNP
ncbi:hypothetical protein [Streptomyces humi]